MRTIFILALLASGLIGCLGEPLPITDEPLHQQACVWGYDSCPAGTTCEGLHRCWYDCGSGRVYPDQPRAWNGTKCLRPGETD